MTSKDLSGVRIVLTPIKIVRDTCTGQWSTPRARKDSIQSLKYNLRVRTPSTPVVSLSSPAPKKEATTHTPRPLTRASRQISFEKDKQEDERNQSSSSDDDDEDEEDEDDDDDDDEDESSSSSDDEKVISHDSNNRKATLVSKGTPAAKKRRTTCLPRVNDQSFSPCLPSHR